MREASTICCIPACGELRWTTYGLDPCWTNNRNVRSALAPSSSHVLIFRAKMKSCGRRIENFVSL